ncbi:MAG: hypothetical protein BMS9Abin08_0707 [Gammaproteobacteria bacterium]|nr:MAG: hypothetical protein BMS9Abin08_0707 [Gammaproteobacteria bacterium]
MATVLKTNHLFAQRCKAIVSVLQVDSLEEQFACAEYLVEEGQAFFDVENLERPKSIPLPEVSARLVRSLRRDCDKAAAKRR